MKINNVFKLIFAVGVSELAGVIGALFTAPAIDGWYVKLAKPALNPPAWVFGPVWTTLFALMGISAWLVWTRLEKNGIAALSGQGETARNDKKENNKKIVKIALAIFFGQLVLNALWSIIFFGLPSLVINGLNNIGIAFFELIILWLAILATIIAFYKISKPAAWLLVPYILWVSFAGYLNYSIWQLSINNENQVSCTMEAKLCPDGSYVGRVGPSCEFAACPESAENGLILGGDKDAHGCIGSAGYSWCEAKQKCLRIFEEDCLAEEKIKSLLAQKYNKQISEVFLRIDKENAKYAAGGVSFGENAKEGGAFLAAKINDEWELVYDGNGSIDCAAIKQNYEFPAEMLVNFCD